MSSNKCVSDMPLAQISIKITLEKKSYFGGLSEYMHFDYVNHYFLVDFLEMQNSFLIFAFAFW